jgi:hypothetical protein
MVDMYAVRHNLHLMLNDSRVGDLISYQSDKECSTTILGKARIA